MGPFTATGPAVDEGLICPTGDTLEVFAKASGFQSPTGLNFQAVKLFTCEDGSGEFLVKLQVRVDFKGGTFNDNFNWVILEGTGACERLRGTGKGTGEEIGFDPFVILDLYSGQAHVA